MQIFNPALPIPSSVMIKTQQDPATDGSIPCDPSVNKHHHLLQVWYTTATCPEGWLASSQTEAAWIMNK
jgi:hypothetical protein